MINILDTVIFEDCYIPDDDELELEGSYTLDGTPVSLDDPKN